MRYFFIFLWTLASPYLLVAQCDNCYGTPFLGIYSNGISKKKAETLDFDNSEGSYVTGIIGNTAAEKAGLQPFDYIFGIDEYRTDYGRSLTSILKKYDIGDEVVVHYYRNGKKQQTKLRLGDRDDAEYKSKSKRKDPFLGVEQRQKNWKDDFLGVKVDIVSNSTAEEMGLEDGDIISQINGFPIYDWTDLGTAIDMTEVGSNMQITYVRDGRKGQVNGNVKSYAASRNASSYSYGSGDYDYDFDFDNEKTLANVRNSENDNSLRRNIDNLDAKISDFSTSKSNDFEADYNVNLPTNSTLTVNKLTLVADKKKGIFGLQFDLPSKGDTQVEIFNNRGRMIYSYELTGFSGDFEDAVDLAQNGVGNYFLKITQNGNHFVKMITLRNH